MGIKEFLIRKMVKYNLIPPYFRWKKSVSGIGRIYLNLMEMMEENYGSEGVDKLSEVMYNIGYNQADEILDLLDLEKSLKGCAYALMTMHRIFGMKSKIEKEESDKIVIHITDCPWGRKKEDWNPRACASIGHYESGLIEATLPDAAHLYPKRHSLGDEVCELIISLKETQDKE